ncbi:GNAT family N-acetyltransferase [Malaciobacter sp. WC5094]
MNDDELREKNINNLRNLFKLMGAQKQVSKKNTNLYFSKTWPNRFWMPYDYGISDLKDLIKINNHKNKIISLWETNKDIFTEANNELISKEYTVLFEQIGMYLNMNELDINLNRDLEIKQVHSKEDIELWTKIASLSFSYKIDSEIIYKVSKDSNINLLLAYKENIPVGTALLYQNSSVMGIHLVGVLQKYRKQGIADNIMKRAISISKEKRIHFMVLQASMLGLGIYEKLGFKKSFVLKNYQKKEIK